MGNVVARAFAPAPSASAPRPFRVSLVGAGYVGLVTAACFAELGHDVTAIEVDATRLARMRAGVLPVYEPGLDDLVNQHTASGRLLVTDGYDAVSDADVVFVAVPTPPRPDGRVDTSLVEAVVRAVLLRSPRATIVIKSTVPPGTIGNLEQIARVEGYPLARFVANPEFLREGQAVHDFLVPDRVVIGTRDRDAGDLVARLYERLRTVTYRTSPEDAELAKYAANVFLAARISLINEVAGIADRVGANVSQVAAIVGADARIGRSFLQAGLGWGGSCFPKDVSGLAALAHDVGASSAMLDGIVAANNDARSRATEIVLDAVRGTTRPLVGMLGLAFKPGTDDVRESPSIALARLLITRGIEVRATDPLAAAHAERVEPRLHLATGVTDAAAGADVLILATEWPEFLAPDWHRVARLMRGSVVLDARNALDPNAVIAAGLSYRSLGRDVLGRNAALEAVACAS